MVTEAMHITTIPRLKFDNRSTPKIPVITLTIEKTPTFTTATACNKALTGVGATIAAGSQV